MNSRCCVQACTLLGLQELFPPWRMYLIKEEMACLHVKTQENTESSLTYDTSTKSKVLTLWWYSLGIQMLWPCSRNSEALDWVPGQEILILIGSGYALWETLDYGSKKSNFIPHLDCVKLQEIKKIKQLSWWLMSSHIYSICGKSPPFYLLLFL